MARRGNKRKFKPAIAVIGEGITEHIYFSQLRHQEKLNFSLKPALPKNSSIKKIVEKAQDLLKEEYDRAFCLFDLDEINRDVTIKEEYNRLKKEHHGKSIVFIENNPCMEFWFLLHYRQTTREFSNYEQLKKLVKKNIPGYEKTEIFLKNRNIYGFLKKYQQTAKKNAIIGIKNQTGNSSISEVHLILEFLGI